MSKLEFEALASSAVECRICFERSLVPSALIDRAQPRWIGSKYWSENPRVTIVMLNPGSGEFRSDGADEELCSLLHAFANGSAQLSAILDHQSRDIVNWGRGRFASFFLHGVGLDLDHIALANIAWCATAQNAYPSKMLKTCFRQHTERLIEILDPDLVVLSGSKTHKFASKLGDVVPKARMLCTLHYAHRKGKHAEDSAAAKIRDAISRATRSPD